jgi:anti-sigma B factor antagonist
VGGLTLEVVARGSSCAVDVAGEIDMATVGQLRVLLDTLIDEGADEIVLRCAGIQFLDSSGIGALVAASNRLERPRALRIEQAPPHVRKVLDLTGASEQLSVLP